MSLFPRYYANGCHIHQNTKVTSSHDNTDSVQGIPRHLIFGSLVTY